MNVTGWSKGLEVTAGGAGVISDFRIRADQRELHGLLATHQGHAAIGRPGTTPWRSPAAARLAPSARPRASPGAGDLRRVAGGFSPPATRLASADIGQPVGIGNMTFAVARFSGATMTFLPFCHCSSTIGNVDVWSAPKWMGPTT